MISRTYLDSILYRDAAVGHTLSYVIKPEVKVWWAEERRTWKHIRISMNQPFTFWIFHRFNKFTQHYIQLELWCSKRTNSIKKSDHAADLWMKQNKIGSINTNFKKSNPCSVEPISIQSYIMTLLLAIHCPMLSNSKLRFDELRKEKHNRPSNLNF